MEPVLDRVRGTVHRWMSKRRASSHSEPLIEPVDIAEEDDDIQQLVQHGSVTISDSQVFVTNPDDNGSFATITIPEDSRLTVTIDGHHCVGRVVVHKDQDIQVSMTCISPTRKLSFRSSKNAMEVTGEVEVTLGEKYRLKDVENTRHGVLEIEGISVYPSPLTDREITDELQSVGYQGIIDQRGVEVLSGAVDHEKAVLLRGIPPIPGKPAHYRPAQLPKIFDPVRRRMRITTVTMGTTVAFFEPEVAGFSGRDVMGNEIAATVHRQLPSLGDGVIRVDRRLVAVCSGRLRFTKERIDVIRELVIEHSLTSKEGKIEFDGDVVVMGSVLDGSYIKATGRVEVIGSILRSTVMGERGVFVKDAITGSQVIAGSAKVLYTKLYSLVKRCSAEYENFRVEYEDVIAYARQRTLPDSRLRLLAKSLLNARHEGLERSLETLCVDTDRLLETDDRYREISAEIRSRWTGIGRTNITEQDVTALHHMLDNYVAHIESMMQAESADVKAVSITSSSIRASGRIVIVGAGTYASSLEAGDTVIIRGSVRGGFLVAKNLIQVNELGTSTGIESSAKVENPSGRIEVRLRHPNTLLQVGHTRHRNSTVEHNAVVWEERNEHPDTTRGRLA